MHLPVRVATGHLYLHSVAVHVWQYWHSENPEGVLPRLQPLSEADNASTNVFMCLCCRQISWHCTSCPGSPAKSCCSTSFASWQDPIIYHARLVATCAARTDTSWGLIRYQSCWWSQLAFLVSMQIGKWFISQRLAGQAAHFMLCEWAPVQDICLLLVKRWICIL